MKHLALFPRRDGWTVTAALLALLCALHLLALWRAPAVFTPAAIAVTLKRGDSITLGQRELAAPHADTTHLGLRRAKDGSWWVRNVSTGKPLLLRRDGADSRTGASALAAGQTFRIGAALFRVAEAGAHDIVLTSSGQSWRYDGATLYRNGSAQPACPGAALTARLGSLWNRAMPRLLTVGRPLLFGGNLNCGNRLGIAWVAGGSAVLALHKGQLMLSGAGGGDERFPLLLTTGDGSVDLAQKEEALAGVAALLVGRTRFALDAQGDTLGMRPLANTALYTEALTQLPPQVSWEWRQRALFALPGGTAWWVALALCALLAAGAALSWQRGAWPFTRETTRHERMSAAASALLAIAGVAALLLQRAGSPPGVALSMLLGWSALWSCLLPPGRLALANAAGVLLLAVGLLAQLELGLGGMESSWLRHYQKTVALLAIGLGAGNHLRLRCRGGAAMLPQTQLEWVLASLAAGALCALLLQVAFGDETGVFDLQPVEFAKLALTALTAHCLAIGLGWNAAMAQQVSAGTARRWLRLAAPALLFAALLALALVQVDDFSPLILLLVWSAAMVLAWAVATRRVAAAGGVVALALLAGGAVAVLRSAGVEEVATWGFYADRFLVWLDPAQHPHTGQQLLVAARAIAEGAWWGADSWLGIFSLGQPAGGALHIPAVQDDFAPSFFLNRHGLLSALALWALQALFLVGLLQGAARAFTASERARDYRQAWLGRFRCFALCGGAAFILGHFLLSWGTNLAIFPIMGQPMSFLSAGGSHLLFFICPLLAFNAISAQSFEENQSCRSTSNVKF